MSEKPKVSDESKDFVCQVILTIYNRPAPNNVRITVKPNVLTQGGILGVLQQAFNNVANRPFVSEPEEKE